MEGKSKFLKAFSLAISSLFLFTTICSAATVSQTKEQRLKSYDELKEIYMNVVGKGNDYSEYDDVIVEDAMEESVAVSAPAPAAARSANTTSAATSGAVSSTNVQVQGVDEGDIVKNDGNYIYTVKSVYEGYSNYSIVNIISTYRTGNMRVVGSLKVEGSCHEMYLNGTKLVLITHPQDVYLDLNTNKHITIQDYNKLSTEYNKNYLTNTGAMNIAFEKRFQYKTRTAALVYDVGNPAKPRYERRVMQDGDYLSSRMIGDQLYMVTNRYNYSWFRYENASDINVYSIIPLVRDSLVSGDPYKMLEPRYICILPDLGSYNFAVVSGFNIKKNTAVTTEACLGGGSNIYASLSSLYVTNNDYSYYRNLGSVSKTSIIKYTLSNGVPKVSAVGSVPGNILNQFSCDEYNNNFRIATTTDTWSSSGSRNNVYVLNSSLNIIGKIENLAPGERIYSVRFMDKKGYVVTFRQVDPLFALDLSNPTNPRVTGQLKIPGFSNYLHPYSENILIGIGNTTTETDYGATLTDGLKLSLFDVSNPFNPKEIQNFILGSRGTSSEVLYNHKALMFSREKNIMGFPVQLYERKAGSSSTDYGNLTYNGYYVFKIDVNKGFSVLGRLTHLSGPIDPKNPWKNEYVGLDIKRGIFVDNTLYTVSEKFVQANSLSDFKAIKQVKLAN